MTTRGTNAQQGSLPKYGLTEVIFGICNSTVLHIQLDVIYLVFCCYLHLQFFNHHRFRADGIPVLRQALSVIRQHYLLDHFENNSIGTEYDGNITFYFSYTNGKVECSGQDFTKYVSNFTDFPKIPH